MEGILSESGIELKLGYQVKGIEKAEDGKLRVRIADKEGKRRSHRRRQGTYLNRKSAEYKGA